MAKEIKDVALLPIDTPTITGNIFSRGVMERALIGVANRKAPMHGEYGSPKYEPGDDSRTYAHRMQSINEKNVSHEITDLRIEGDTLVGKVVFANTPKGLAAQMLSHGSPKFAMRSFVDKGKDGKIRNCQIVTFDLVRETS